MPIFINTCVYADGSLNKMKDYIDKYGDDVAFEILSKADTFEWDKEMETVLDMLSNTRIGFHGPVWEAEHSAKKGTKEYDHTMEMIYRTAKFAKILNCEHVVYHLNNCEVVDGMQDEMLKNSLENLKEIREIFDFSKIFVENTGTKVQKNALLTQSEFTDLCRDQKFDVLIDIGHAHANGWDLYKILDDLGPQIRAFHLHNNDGQHDLHNRLLDGTFDFDKWIRVAKEKLPDAKYIIEYIRPAYEGQPLMEDFEYLRNILNN